MTTGRLGGRTLGLLGGVILLATLPATARADVTGEACVIDAGHLSIGGKRAYGRCQGGTAITLAAIDAPSPQQTCTTPAGKPWDCGRWAAYVLVEISKNKKVICQGAEKDDKGALLALCYAGGRQINRTLVELGWALPATEDPSFAAAVAKARSAAVGLWQGTFDPPAEWRARHKH
ncbi:nuclease [Rhodospirillum rubrum]|uniref:thermonuclease family protein n=1 Tax=Rhodospirillum rubrum TaxID=1085 RepID=UPI001903E217|nr:thermonuclease family protein [Rhodospirillum rubrum]MBK1663535.1 nuclease [Rhodospirillum rubrum]MBK1675664.1 nuclease [Rhodospirillum rubrum]